VIKNLSLNLCVKTQILKALPADLAPVEDMTQEVTTPLETASNPQPGLMTPSSKKETKKTAIRPPPTTPRQKNKKSQVPLKTIDLVRVGAQIRTAYR